MNCKNCGREVAENYCPNCGQSTKVDRINLSNVVRELSESVFQIDKGLFYTAKELFVRPGRSIKEYLDGKRKKHFKPIAYALTLSTIYFILSQLLGSKTFVSDFLVGYTDAMETPTTETQQLALLKWFAKNYAYTTLFLLPIYALASYLAFYKAGFNYLEHFVLNAYITGQQAIIYALFSVSNLLIDNRDLLASATLCLSIAYAFYVFWQFFDAQSRIAVVLRALLTYVLSLLFLLTVLFIFFLATR